MNLNQFTQTVSSHGYLQERTETNAVTVFSRLENNVKVEVRFYSCTSTGIPDFFGLTFFKGAKYVDSAIGYFTSYKAVAEMLV